MLSAITRSICCLYRFSRALRTIDKDRLQDQRGILFIF